MRPITDTLRDIRKGRVVEAATEELAEVVLAAIETGKPGSLTLKLTVKPHAKGDSAVILDAVITTSVPKADLPNAIFFAGPQGDLLRDDPTNQRMFAEVERVDPTTGEVLSA